MIPAGSDGHNWLGQQVLDQSWNELVLTRPVPELSMLTKSKSIQLAIGGQDHAVVTAGLDLFDMTLIL